MSSPTPAGSRARVLPSELLLLALLVAVGAHADTDIITLNSTSSRIQYQGPWSTSDDFRVSLTRSQTFAVFWSGSWLSTRISLPSFAALDTALTIVSPPFQELASVFRARSRVTSLPYSSPLIIIPSRRHWNQAQMGWYIPPQALRTAIISCSCLAFLHPTPLQTFICIT